MFHVPAADEMLDNLCVMFRCVHAELLRDGGELLEQVRAGAIFHQMRGHHDLVAHQIAKRQHGAVGVLLKNMTHEIGVRLFVARFVGGDGAANALQMFIAFRARELGDVLVRNLGGPFLKRGVNKSLVRILRRAGIKSVP